MSNETIQTYNEAPASATIRMASPAGYDVLFTLRGVSGAELLPKLEAAITWASEHGYTPTAARASTNGNAESTPADPDVLIDERGKRYKVCELHQARMYEKTGKGGQVWYSHQLADGGWCKGGAK